MQVGHPVHALRAEDAMNFPSYGTTALLKMPVTRGRRSPADDRIGVITPDHIGVARGFGCQGIFGSPDR